MISGMDHSHLPTTEAAVDALREIAREFHLECDVAHDIGADQTSRRTAAGFATTDPDGSLPHEAHVELGGSPRITVRLFPEDDALITVEGVEFHDVPRDEAPAFLRSCYSGLAYVHGKRFPPGYRLVVPLPGDRTYKEFLPMIQLTPWLSSRVR
ncbi:hypothetical protein G3I40_43700 [Streptomyces sp. SID14478]|uniref:hypothetical protein n=1 Tax=Streptomyces sp. SID14478 TaxID=2706073 RepID=UPI0013DF1373|nr:hypothetical protein [Streptomyces sp. SID14478]NEB82068.1 hypothetical protein [Streptomyces sp. SID14478]